MLELYSAKIWALVVEKLISSMMIFGSIWFDSSYSLKTALGRFKPFLD
jgi:hypothetical protein